MTVLIGHGAMAATAGYPKHEEPIPTATLALMKSRGTSSGRFTLLKTFPICRWSGQLGPKIKEGDRQAPEGFYAITPAQMNPNSAHYLSFDTGFPNAYDRSRGATGSALMVHGTCSSAGRYAFRAAKDPARETSVLAYRAQEDDHAAALLEEGRPAVRTTYADGGQHP